jgi:hypothetical protein
MNNRTVKDVLNEYRRSTNYSLRLWPGNADPVDWGELESRLNEYIETVVKPALAEDAKRKFMEKFRSDVHIVRCATTPGLPSPVEVDSTTEREEQ